MGMAVRGVGVQSLFRGALFQKQFPIYNQIFSHDRYGTECASTIVRTTEIFPGLY